MSNRTISITLPDALYERVKETAEVSKRSIEEVLAQSVALSLPELETDLPADLRTNLTRMALLSDAGLWQIAASSADEKQQAQLEELAELQKQRPLTVPEQEAVAELIAQAQLIMLRKAEAYRLLARRGHAVFSAHLPTPA